MDSETASKIWELLFWSATTWAKKKEDLFLFWFWCFRFFSVTWKHKQYDTAWLPLLKNLTARCCRPPHLCKPSAGNTRGRPRATAEQREWLTLQFRYTTDSVEMRTKDLSGVFVTFWLLLFFSFLFLLRRCLIDYKANEAETHRSSSGVIKNGKEIWGGRQ